MKKYTVRIIERAPNGSTSAKNITMKAFSIYEVLVHVQAYCDSCMSGSRELVAIWQASQGNFVAKKG